MCQNSFVLVQIEKNKKLLVINSNCVRDNQAIFKDLIEEHTILYDETPAEGSVWHNVKVLGIFENVQTAKEEMLKYMFTSSGQESKDNTGPEQMMTKLSPTMKKYSSVENLSDSELLFKVPLPSPVSQKSELSTYQQLMLDRIKEFHERIQNHYNQSLLVNMLNNSSHHGFICTQEHLREFSCHLNSSEFRSKVVHDLEQQLTNNVTESVFKILNFLFNYNARFNFCWKPTTEQKTSVQSTTLYHVVKSKHLCNT
ncbi:unnamed protein product [Heterobilharzia americana]|nr:unnamed protein product [Heterobilharzia americana]